jgi:hypothetical protein|tara:strand:- start:5464 stop:6159 length:696 start_codon:yes stop_codon:yes gene_type:complete
MNEVNKKVMLNTKDMSAGSGRTKPVLDPGNHVVKINSISLDQTPYDADSYNIHLHVETAPIGGGFEGFFRDYNDQSKGRYDGQIGRVRISPYPFKDTTLPSGREISRDQEILKHMITLAETLDMRDGLDSIEAETIEDFMTECDRLMGGSKLINMCIGGREWENKEGYINNDLYLPRISKDGIAMEALDKENSRLLKFDRAVHVKALVKKESSNDETPFKADSGSGSDFEL